MLYPDRECRSIETLEEITSVNATLIQKCKDLAAASLAEYKGEHGEPPWTEQDQAEIEELFTADFRELCRSGAQSSDQDACREAWTAAFFQLPEVG